MSQKRIPIAFCITELEPGGAEKALVRLACRLDSNLFEVVVYSLRSRSWHHNDTFIKLLDRRDVRVEFLNMKNCFSIFRAVRELRVRLQAFKPVVFQSFLFHANLVGRLAAHAAHVPMVCSGIRVAEKKKKWHLVLDWLTQRYVNKYICVSRSVADFTRNRGRISPKKIAVVTNGLDPDMPYDASDVLLPLPERYTEHPAVVFLGRLHEQKGVDWLLDTTSDWLDQRKPWHLWFMGDGPLREHLVHKVSSFPFAGRVHFPGWQGNVFEILRHASLLVLPSRWEGMPNVVMEAMAAARPVLVSDAEGIRELLGDDDRQIVPYGDSAAFSARMAAFLDDPELRTTVGNANRERVIKYFNINEKVQEYLELWENLV